MHGGTQVIPFNLSVNDALASFAAWSHESTPFSQPPPLARPVRSLLLPFWAFRSRLSHPSLKGTTWEAGPSMQVYAGSELPRGMAEVAKASANAALNAAAFSSASFSLPDGGEAAVEPFRTYETTAWALARQAVLASAAKAAGLPAPLDAERASFQEIESARLLLPVHIITYAHLFVEFRVIVNGVTGAAFGLPQRPALGALADWVGYIVTSADGRSRFADLGRTVSRDPVLAGLYAFIETLVLRYSRPLLMLLLWPPFLAGSVLSLGAYVMANLTHGLRAERAAFSRWEEERLAEARAQERLDDTWLFRRTEPRQGSQPPPPRGSSAGSSSRERAPPNSQQARTAPFSGKPPPVDANDFYAVLGLSGRPPSQVATADIQAGFRRELLKYHPDHAVSSGLDPSACSERSRQIIAAYTVLRDPAKRAAYDSRRGGRRGG